MLEASGRGKLSHVATQPRDTLSPLARLSPNSSLIPFDSLILLVCVESGASTQFTLQCGVPEDQSNWVGVLNGVTGVVTASVSVNLIPVGAKHWSP